MIHSFQLSHYRRANVWLDEAPPADFTAASLVTRHVMPRMIVEAQRRIAGIEFNIPHGPRASYALLGAELVDTDVEGLEVAVSVNKLGFPFQRAIALKPDEVKVGLLDEYSSAVIAGVAKVAEAVGAPTKMELRFRWAAHAVVGSSPSAFEKASELVLQLLMLPEDVRDEQVRALLG
jgi:hypothetical protein